MQPADFAPVRRLWLYVDGKPSMSTTNTPYRVRDIHKRVIPSWRQDFPDAKFEVIETIELPLARLEALEQIEKVARAFQLALIGNSDDAPPHDCEFFSNPERGACAFHDAWADFISLAARDGREG